MSGKESRAPLAKEPLWTKDFLMVSLLGFFLYTAFQIFPAALPPYLKSLGAGDEVIGWIAIAATVSTLIIRPISGHLLDTMGRKFALVVGLAVSAASTLAFYFFPVIGVILLLRFIQGIGSGMATTASSTTATDIIPKSRFGEGMGYFILSSNVAMAIAPAIGLALLPGPMILTTTGFFLLALGMAFVLRYRPLPPKPEHRGKIPFPYEKKAVIPAVVIMLSTCGFGAILTFLAIYAAHRGIEQNIGVFFTVYAAVVFLSRPQTGKLVDRKGPEMLVVPALLLNMSGLFILSSAEVLLEFLAAAAVFGLGQSMTVTSTQAMAVLYSPIYRRGAAMATFYTGFDLGSGLGAFLAGYFSVLVGYSGMFRLMMLLPGLAVAIYIGSRVYARGKESWMGDTDGMDGPDEMDD